MFSYKDALLRNKKILSNDRKYTTQNNQLRQSHVKTDQKNFCDMMIVLPEEIWRKIFYYFNNSDNSENSDNSDSSDNSENSDNLPDLNSSKNKIDMIKFKLNLCFVNKLFYKIVSNNIFWINENKGYSCAKFNIYNSICRFVNIYDKVKYADFHSEGKDLQLYSNEIINSKSYDEDNLPDNYNCEFDTKLLYTINTNEYYDYCALCIVWRSV